MAVLPSKARPALIRAAQNAGDDYGITAEPDWREVNWREHLHWMDLDGGQVNYVDMGSGDAPPLLFVHGLGGCWQNWLENIPRLAASGRRVVALDLPGFGYSEPPADKITISGYGRCVNALCDELDLGEVAVVGNSMGGFTAAETAIQFPKRVARLVLNSAAGMTTTDLAHGPLLAGARAVAALGTRTAAMSEKLVVRKRLRRPVYMTFIRYPDRIPTDLLFEITRGAGRPAFTDALRAIFEYDFRDRLPEIRCPTLIVWGDQDMLVPRKDADRFERLIPNSRKEILRDTGHSAMIERPRTFNDLMLEFLGEAAEPPKAESDLGAPAAVRGADAAAGSNGGGSAAVEAASSDAS